MLIPDGESSAEFAISKSRFLSRVDIIKTAEQARSIVKVLKKEHPLSSHVVYAFISGKTGDIFGLSDDREPSGTAGRPILTVLKGSGITNIIITVVRYFGGIKLGTGGLVKAYTEAAQVVLKNLPVTEDILKIPFHLNIPYNLYKYSIKLIKLYNGIIHSTEYQTDIRIEGIIPEKSRSELEKKLLDLSNGKISLIISDSMDYLINPLN